MAAQESKENLRSYQNLRWGDDTIEAARASLSDQRLLTMEQQQQAVALLRRLVVCTEIPRNSLGDTESLYQDTWAFLQKVDGDAIIRHYRDHLSEVDRPGAERKKV